MTRQQDSLTGLTLSRHSRNHTRSGYAMRAYLKVVAIVVGLLGTYLALLPLSI